MRRCDMTGLLSHWEVTKADGTKLYFNGVRSMTMWMRANGCNITRSNFYDLERAPLSKKRGQRFSDVGIDKILKITEGRLIFDASRVFLDDTTDK